MTRPARTAARTGRPRVSQDEIEHARASLVDTVRAYLDITPDGSEYKALCPFHDDRNPSLYVVPAKKFVHCHACGAHEDAIGFVMRMDSCDFTAAVAKINGGLDADTEQPRRVRRAPDLPPPVPYDDYKPIIPIPDTAPPIVAGQRTPSLLNIKRIDDPRRREWSPTPTLAHAYRTADGGLYGYVLRIDLGNGRKITPQVMYCRCPDGTERWCMRPFPAPRPLYGLDRRVADPDSPVVIVEGEKAADAAARLLPKFTVLSWAGGTQNRLLTDWSPLRGAKVVAWPDNDPPGLGAMLGEIDDHGRTRAGVQQFAAEHGAAAFRCVDPETVASGPKGDAADCEAAGWDTRQTVAWMKANRLPADDMQPVDHRPPPAVVPDQPEGDQEPPPPDEDPHGGGEPVEEPPQALGPVTPYFRIVGYHLKDIFFLPAGGKQVLSFSAPSLGDVGNLQLLAPLQWWESWFPSRQKPNIDTIAAREFLIAASRQVGIYDPDNLRGRGAWWDHGRVVLHLGDRLVVDGTPIGLTAIDSEHIYEARPRFRISQAAPLPDHDAKAFAEICGDLRWERPLASYLFGGWIVVAQICGALRWRPHLWVNGPAGSGKSWIQSKIIKPALGGLAVSYSAKTTEPGIRRDLSGDARPVIFDEIEAEGRQAQQRIQDILFLARAAASDDGAPIVQAGKSGAERFHIRSCFNFASINVSLKEKADADRWVSVSLTTHDPQDPEAVAAAELHFAELERKVAALMVDDFASRLLARTLSCLPAIIDNIKTFTQAAVTELGSRRHGDELGTLLAGYYSLHSRNRISLEAARRWLQGKDWSDQLAGVGAERDDEKLIRLIMQTTARVQDSWGVGYELSHGELIAIATGREHHEKIGQDRAFKALGKQGLKPNGRFVYVANRSPALERALQDTPWAANWAGALKSISGAEAVQKPIRFSTAYLQRGTAVPMTAVFGDDDSGQQTMALDDGRLDGDPDF